MIDKAYEEVRSLTKKPRTNRRIARKKYLKVAKKPGRKRRYRLNLIMTKLKETSETAIRY